MTFRSILCPVDFSPHSRAALRFAAELARRFGARLSVIFVKAVNHALSERDRIEIAGIEALLSVGSGRKAVKP